MAKHDRASVTATAELEFEEVIAEDECKGSQSHSTSAPTSLAGELGFDFDALDLLDAETAETGLRLPSEPDNFTCFTFEAPRLELLEPPAEGPLKSAKSVGFNLAVPMPESPIRSRSVPNHWRIRAQIEPPTPLRRCSSIQSGLGFRTASLTSVTASPHAKDVAAEEVEGQDDATTGLRVAIVVSGSRGDVQPLVALALVLRRLGHQVCIFTNANHTALCERHGVDMVPVFADSQACIQRIGGVSGETLMSSLPSVSRAQRAAKKWFEEHPGKCSSLEDALEDFAPETLVTSNEASTAALRYENLTGTPVIFACFFRAMMEFQSSMLYLQPPRPAFLAASILLDETAAVDDHSCLLQTGPWLLEDQPTPAELSQGSLAQLRKFLAAGSPPVAVCWGSMILAGMQPRSMLRLALTALRTARRRGVVVGGYALLHELGESLLNGELAEEAGWHDLAQFARQSVFFIAEVPHAWLLPHCSCLVHHGGAGTLQTALREGVPSVVTPIFADQFDNSRAVARLSAGVGFEENLSQVSAFELAEAIHEAEACRPEVRSLGEQLRDNNGAQQAARRIDAFLREEVAKGHFAHQVADARKKRT